MTVDMLQGATLACAGGIFAFKLPPTRVAAAEPKLHESAVHGLARTGGIGRDQRGGAVPVFRRVVHIEQFRDRPERASPIQDGALRAGHWIARRGGRERKEALLSRLSRICLSRMGSALSAPRFSWASTMRRFWFFSASCPAVPMTSSISRAKFTGFFVISSTV
jgi:hypothetical protein